MTDLLVPNPDDSGVGWPRGRRPGPGRRDLLLTSEEPDPHWVPARRPVSARDVLQMAFRHQRLIAVAFPAILAAILVPVLLWPWPYRAEMKILVKQDRVDPLVSSEVSQRTMEARGVSEQDLNSEVELIKSRDLLERVVVSTGLHLGSGSWMANLRNRLTGRPSESADSTARILPAALALRSALTVEPVQKTSLISVSYDSKDPELSARVLKALAQNYLVKHLEVHRPVGMLDFFSQETERYRAQLDAAKARMAAFSNSEGVASASAERDAAVRQLTDLTQQLSETQALLAAARERLSVLNAQQGRTPARTSTDSREASARLQEVQRSKLLELELKRIELMRVYQPDYPPVVEVEQQLTATREAIARAERSPIREEATDVNPTYEWLTTESAKARSDLGALEARRASLSGLLSAARDRALKLDRLALLSHDLEREIKSAEENFVTYQRKQEVARISSDLDARGIVNVAVADPATVPLAPDRPSRLLMLLLAAVAATLGSLGLAFAADLLDPSFRTPGEVYTLLDVPVLASFPRDPGRPPAIVSRQRPDGGQPLGP